MILIVHLLPAKDRVYFLKIKGRVYERESAANFRALL